MRDEIKPILQPDFFSPIFFSPMFSTRCFQPNFFSPMFSALVIQDIEGFRVKLFIVDKLLEFKVPFQLPTTLLLIHQ